MKSESPVQRISIYHSLVRNAKTSALTLDLHTRAYAFLGTSERGAHPVLEPGLALHFSY